MKIKFIIPLTVCCSLQYYSCGSKGYEIEEIQQEVHNTDIADRYPAADEHSKESSTVEKLREPQEKIKENLFERNVEKEHTENGATNKSSFTIQIGAFVWESNALNLLSSAKGRLSYDVYYKLVDGLYKVRAGEFASKSDALIVIDMIRNAGFGDAFIIER